MREGEQKLLSHLSERISHEEMHRYFLIIALLLVCCCIAQEKQASNRGLFLQNLKRKFFTSSTEATPSSRNFSEVAPGADGGREAKCKRNFKHLCLF